MRGEIIITKTTQKSNWGSTAWIETTQGVAWPRSISTVVKF